MDVSPFPVLTSGSPSPAGPLLDTIHHEDAAPPIEGLYRIFDLINEQGNNGLVDKIIIAQEELERLINDLHPKAYMALTRVDFKALDSLSIRPIGVYGDRCEITKFLTSLKVINDDQFQFLRSKDGFSGSLYLRSGIYIAKPPGLPDILYAIYWPEAETWKDCAPSGPRRNRVTFMRYLTKISDQILCFMSDTQIQAFIWDNEEINASGYQIDKEDGDRMYTFEITQINEQEENVVCQQGFRIASKLMRVPEAPDLGTLPRPPPPVLILGEKTQGFLSVKSIPPRTDEQSLCGAFSAMRLKTLLGSSSVRIECDLDGKAISALISNGLDRRPYTDYCKVWRDRERTISNENDNIRAQKLEILKKDLLAGEEELGKKILVYLIERVLEKYPTLAPDRLLAGFELELKELSDLKGALRTHFKANCAENILHDPVWSNLEKKTLEFPSGFKEQKQRIACVYVIAEKYPQHYNEQLVHDIIKDGHKERFGAQQSMFTRWFSSRSGEEMDLKKDVEEYCRKVTDKDFIARLDTHLEREPLVEPAVCSIYEMVYSSISRTLMRNLDSFKRFALARQSEIMKASVINEWKQAKEEASKSSGKTFVENINSLLASSADGVAVVTLERFEVKDGSIKCYDISARQQMHLSSTFQYTINRLDIQTEHQHTLQLNPLFIPTLTVNDRRSVSFTLPPDRRIIHSQLLAADHVLLVIDQGEKIGVYLDILSSINNVLSNDVRKKSIDKGRVGTNVLVSFDETKRLLVFCAPQKRTLHVFAFDEQFSNLQGWASPFELSDWYNNSETITHVCFVTGTGSEEVLLVDSRAQARIYSLVTQGFRPASVTLPGNPTCAMSSPDGACALLVFETDDQRLLIAYHWDSFGASQGINIVLPDRYGSVSVTSFVNQQSIHLMMLDEEQGHCQSVALSITKKSSEFTFKEKGTRVSVDTVKGENYVNNCLVDCFADVWTRFPVLAAVSRQFITSACREPKSITFISSRGHNRYASYFSDMVQSFEDQTKKPTDEQLRSISIKAKTYPALIDDLVQCPSSGITQFLAGQWFVNLLYPHCCCPR